MGAAEECRARGGYLPKISSSLDAELMTKALRHYDLCYLKNHVTSVPPKQSPHIGDITFIGVRQTQVAS